MDQTPIRIIQISDIHLFGDPKHSLLGVNTQESFEAVLDLVQKNIANVDMLLLTGDLSQDGSEIAYKRIADALKNFNLPIYYIVGNHDNTKVMTHVYPSQSISSHRHIVLKDWHIILLNSQKPGAVEGLLDPSQLNYMQHCLQTYPQHHAMVVFHHPPLPVGAKWLDNLNLSNADEFWKIITRYPKVNVVLTGHVHLEYEKIVHGIQCLTSPSTCIQFKRGQDHFGLDNVPPGYRWIELYPDGSVKSGITRVDKYIGDFDEDATGY